MFDFDMILPNITNNTPYLVQNKPPTIGGLTYNANCMGVE